MSKHVDSIPSLTMDNYYSWAKQMEWHLKGRKQGVRLWQCVQQSEEAALVEVDDETQAELNAQVQSILMRAVPSVLEDTVHTATSARNAWLGIKCFFEQGNQERKASMLREFLSLKQGSQDIPVFLLELQSMRDALKEKCQYEVDEDLLMLVLTDAVRGEFAAKLDVVKLKDAYTFADMKQALISEDLRLRHQPGSVLQTRGNNSNVYCYACGAPGHKRPECTATQTQKDTWRLKRQQASTNKQGASGGAAVCFTASDANLRNSTSHTIIYDSGASHHVVNDASFLHDVRQSTLSTIRAAGNECHAVVSMGDVIIQPDVGPVVKIRNVHLVPSFSCSLLSGPCLDQVGAIACTRNSCTTVMTQDKTVAFVAPLHMNQYVVKGAFVRSNQIGTCMSTTSAATNALWHRRLAHLGSASIQRMVREDMAVGMTMSPANCAEPACSTCLVSKHARSPFGPVRRTVSRLLEVVHTDVVGPLRTSALGGARFSLTIVDQYSSMSAVVLLASKGAAGHALLEVLQRWQRLTGQQVVTVRSDRGGEFSSNMLQSALKESGVTHEYTTPYTPQQNGVAERMNRTLFEKVRCLLHGAALPDHYWGLALQAASDVRNLCPVSGQALTPFEVFMGRKPDLRMLRVFGCDCFVHVPAIRCRDPKLGSRSTPAVLVGYSETSKAWKVATVSNGRSTVSDSRDVVFLEHSFEHGQRSTRRSATVDWMTSDVVEATTAVPLPAPDPAIGNNEDDFHEVPAVVGQPLEPAPLDEAQLDLFPEEAHPNDAENPDNPVPPPPDVAPPAALAPPDEAGPRRSSRSTRGVPATQYLHEYGAAQVANGTLTDEPKTLTEISKRPDFALWEQSMSEEMTSLLAMGVYEVVPKPPHAQPLGCRWVFKIKRDALGNVEKYKSRLVVKGFQQTAGTDYEEIFAPVSRHATVRTLLAHCAVLDLEILQLDVKTAFLHGRLDEELYMKMPPGYDNDGEVCRLHRSLYGLKQAARAWFLRLKQDLIDLGYRVSSADPALYIRGTGVDRVLLLVYVDDVLIMGQLLAASAAKTEFMSAYECRDMGDVHYFLGIEVVRDRTTRTLWIGQRKLLMDFLSHYNLAEANAVSLPMDAGAKLHKCASDAERAVDKPYREAIGKLLYAANCSRPDIIYVVGKLAQFVSDPSLEHFSIAKRVLRYLKGTLDLGIQYGPAPTTLQGYSDSDLAGDTVLRRSTSGILFMLHGGAVVWISRLQRTVAASTCEAEYISACCATKEALWLRKLLADLTDQANSVPICIPMRGDNQAALALLNEPGSGSRSTSKYIDLAYHFARDRVARGDISYTYVPTGGMLADGLTKQLPKPAFDKQRLSWGMQVQGHRK